MREQAHFYSGHTVGDKTFYHFAGPFDSRNDARDWQKTAQPTVPDGFTLVVLKISVTKNGEGKSEYKSEVV